MTTNHLNKLYSKIAEELDISDTHFERATTSYRAVGQYIGNHTSYRLDVYTQGSFRLGTVIRPLSDEDDFDLDLVCEYTDGHQLSAKDLKHNVGEILRNSQRYSSNLTEKRRCWRIDYANEAHFHMDITPAIPVTMRSSSINVTDKKDEGNYSFSASNPKNYADWFSEKCAITQMIEKKINYASTNVEPIKKYGAKFPLQKAIQILKRHRDKMFEEDPENKPISIIITTLAAQAYGGEYGVYDSIKTILETMERFIHRNSGGFSIQNPTNPKENFADKWNSHPERAKAFFKWIYDAKKNLVILPLNIVDNYTTLEEALGATIIDRALIAVDTKNDNSVDPLTPYQRPAVQDALRAPHRQKPNFPFPDIYCLTINATVIDKVNQYSYKNNGEPIKKNCSINFNLKGASALFTGKYDVKWQIVNTGVEAKQANSLRGGFQTKKNTKTHSENTLYTGIHYVQAFLLKRNKCVARSREFIINIQ